MPVNKPYIWFDMMNEIITCFLSPFDVEAKSKVAGGDEFQMLILQAGKHFHSEN